MNHERRADFIAADGVLHRHVASVVAAHKADLHQLLSGSLLGGDDLLAFLCGLRQRLFTEHKFLVADCLQNVGGVRRVCRGDHNGIDIRRGDQIFSGLKCGAVKHLCGALRCRQEIIRNACHDGFRNDIGEPAQMLSSNCAAADDAYTELLFHENLPSLLVCCGYIITLK